MKMILPHRLWLGMFAAAVLLYVCAAPLVDYLQAGQAQQAQKLKSTRAQTEQSLYQLEDDIATAQKLGSQMDAAELARLLSPVDRLKITAMLERQAQAAHFRNFTYMVSPEEKLIVATSGAGPQELAQSEITMTADIPLDRDAYAFVDQVRRLLPGRAQLQSLTLERSAAGVSAVNLHMTANFLWLSTGTPQTIVGGL